VDLTHVDVGVEAVRVAGLVVNGRSSGLAFVYGARDLSQFSIEPVYRCFLHLEPGTAVDPGSPAAEVGYGLRRITVAQLLRQPMQRFYQGTMLVAVVDAEIHIRARVSLSTRPRTAQGDRHDALDLPEPSGYLLGQLYSCLHSTGFPKVRRWVRRNEGYTNYCGPLRRIWLREPLSPRPPS
jgi:hypothetical protein